MCASEENIYKVYDIISIKEMWDILTLWYLNY